VGDGAALSIASHHRRTGRGSQQKGMGHQLRDGDRRLDLTKSPNSMTLRHSVRDRKSWEYGVSVVWVFRDSGSQQPLSGTLLYRCAGRPLCRLSADAPGKASQVPALRGAVLDCLLHWR
jgi:hypothetical protein